MSASLIGYSLAEAHAWLATLTAYALITRYEAAPADGDAATARCTAAVVMPHARDGLPVDGWRTRVPTGLSGTLTFQVASGATFRLHFAGPVRTAA